jgi:TPR repeat protein
MQPLGTNPAGSGRKFNPAIHNRRRRVRHKVHTPAYARLNDAHGPVAADLSEILNISEQGIAIQTASALEANSRLDLCLDLSETQATIPTHGRVIWSDEAGRAGIHFPAMPDEQLGKLKEWLFVNAISACVDYETVGELEAAEVSTAIHSPDKHWETGAAAQEFQSQESQGYPSPDYTTLLAALAAVRREVEAQGSDLDAALLLIARRAQTFTRASGAAIALAEGTEMVCRASSGHDAPSLGVRLKAGSGFSGECVKTGKLLRCEDSETDERADRESCRLLGIRSMVAAPIRWGSAVIGLLEVFSSQSFNFRDDDEKALLQLAEIASAAIYRAGAPPSLRETPAPNVDDEFPVEPPIDAAVIRPLSRTRKILLGAAAATLALVVVWLMTPWSGRGASPTGGQAINAQPQDSLRLKPAGATAIDASNLPDLRRLAEQGDAAAQFALGSRYATGEDVPQDYSEAVRWFSMAAEQGHVISQATLGAYYWAGRGVPQDLVKAYFWSVLAQTGGDEASKYRVALLASRMTRGQVVAAQQQANDWIKQHQLASKNSPAAQ